MRSLLLLKSHPQFYQITYKLTGARAAVTFAARSFFFFLPPPPLSFSHDSCIIPALPLNPRCSVLREPPRSVAAPTESRLVCLCVYVCVCLCVRFSAANLHWPTRSRGAGIFFYSRGGSRALQREPITSQPRASSSSLVRHRPPLTPLTPHLQPLPRANECARTDSLSPEPNEFLHFPDLRFLHAAEMNEPVSSYLKVPPTSNHMLLTHSLTLPSAPPQNKLD